MKKTLPAVSESTRFSAILRGIRKAKARADEGSDRCCPTTISEPLCFFCWEVWGCRRFLVPTNGKHHTIVPHTKRGKPVQYDIIHPTVSSVTILFQNFIYIIIRVSIAKSTYLILCIYLSAASLQYVPICLGQ